MKATIDGIEYSGTPEEIVELVKKLGLVEPRIRTYSQGVPPVNMPSYDDFSLGKGEPGDWTTTPPRPIMCSCHGKSSVNPNAGL